MPDYHHGRQCTRTPISWQDWQDRRPISAIRIREINYNVKFHSFIYFCRPVDKNNYHPILSINGPDKLLDIHVYTLDIILQAACRVFPINISLSSTLFFYTKLMLKEVLAINGTSTITNCCLHKKICLPNGSNI